MKRRAGCASAAPRRAGGSSLRRPPRSAAGVRPPGRRSGREAARFAKAPVGCTVRTVPRRRAARAVCRQGDNFRSRIDNGIDAPSSSRPSLRPRRWRDYGNAVDLELACSPFPMQPAVCVVRKNRKQIGRKERLDHACEEGFACLTASRALLRANPIAGAEKISLMVCRRASNRSSHALPDCSPSKPTTPDAMNEATA